MRPVGLCACLALVLCVSAAGASTANAKVTLSGYGVDGDSPDSTCDQMSVSAVRAKHVLAGTLETIGDVKCGSPGDFHIFAGSVTCMKINHDRVTVGAFGTAEDEYFGTKTKLPGTYAQLLTIEFGSFPNAMGGAEPYTFSFGMLGPADEGIESSSPPSCKHASFSKQRLPSNRGSMTMTR
jgi:hypothetical protein